MTPNACRSTAPIGSGTQKHSVALSGTQWQSVALRSTQKHSEALRSTQKHSVALSGTHKHSEALSGTQWHSEALRGTQRHSPAVSAIKIDWPRHLSDEAIESRVVPGDGCTTCLCSPRTRLMKDDLPTLGRPIT